LSMIEELRAEIMEVRQDIRRILDILQPRKCSQADLRILAELLPAIAGKFGSCAITTREILEDPGIRALFAGSAGSLGALLGKAADDGAEANGYCVQRGGKVHSAMTWGVYRLPKSIDASGCR
jgi:hypothetical protein